MNRHTPGPWHLDETFVDGKWGNPSHWVCEIVGPDNSRIVADIPEYRTYEEDAAELEANARLIAAAPTLLSSLSKKVNDAEQACFEDWLDGELPSGDHEEVQRKWRNSSYYKDFFVEWGEQIAAIEEATGESA